MIFTQNYIITFFIACQEVCDEYFVCTPGAPDTAGMKGEKCPHLIVKRSRALGSVCQGSNFIFQNYFEKTSRHQVCWFFIITASIAQKE